MDSKKPILSSNLPTRSIRLTGLHSGLRKALQNDKSKISAILDKYATRFGGHKPDKRGEKSRLRAFYSGIIQPTSWMKRTLFVPLFHHWSIEPSLVTFNQTKKEMNSKPKGWHYDDRKQLLNYMRQKVTPSFSDEKMLQISLEPWYKASFCDQSKIIHEIIKVMEKGYLKSEVLRLSGKNLSYYSTDLETLSKKIPHLSKFNIMEVLNDQKSIFTHEKRKWYIHCKPDELEESIEIIPKTENRYLKELEINGNGTVEKYKLDFRKRKSNYKAYQKSWLAHVDFFNHFSNSPDLLELDKSIDRYNRYIVYQMNLFWEFFSEGLIDLRDTLQKPKVRKYIGVGGNSRGWHHLVIARAIMKLSSEEEKKQFFDLEPDSKIRSQFDNGKAEKRWNKFLENPRHSTVKTTGDVYYCEEITNSYTQERCGALLVEKIDDSKYELWECKESYCGGFIEFSPDKRLMPLEKKSSNELVRKQETRRRQNPFNLQHLWQILQERDFDKKISRWERKLTREQKEFLTNDRLILSQGDVERFKQKMDDYFNDQ
jgi:hypothetical protein